jgi:phage-related protein
LEWIGGSKKDLIALPDEVVDVFGYALYLAQTGGKHAQAKALHGFGSAGVLEVVEDWRGNIYRAVYTVRFCGAGVRAACVSEEVQVGNRDSEARRGFNQG